MRSSFFFPAIAGLAFALPKPQDIDLDMVIAEPDPTYTTTLGLTAQVISYDPTVLIAEATAAASSISIAVSNVADPTGAPKVKRAACDVQPTGIAAYALQSDSASAFRANASWAVLASAAAAPSGFVRTQVNAGGANQGYGYLGYHNLDSYDVNKCGSICTNTLGCMSFNLYVERDPSVDPGAGCENPPSVIYAKCALWGSPLSSDSATNTGSMRTNFEVAVAGSNAYQNNTLTIPAGYTLVDTLEDAAINAPYDGQGYNTYMGATILTQGTFSIQACADYCSAQTAYNVKHPAQDGTPPKICNFFNTYMLYKNDASMPQGQYCALYTETWEKSYATNKGQYRGSDYYFVRYSYTLGNLTSVAPAHGTGDPKGAIYQARQDMTYFPSSLTSTFLPFCSSVLGFVASTSSVTVLTTTTPIVTVTSLVTVTSQPMRRAVTPTTTPAVLTKYPGTVISAACKLLVTSSPQASTVTTSATITAATSTSTVQSTIVVDSTPATQVVDGSGSCGCKYTQTVNTEFVDPNNNVDVGQSQSLSDCRQRCDNNFDCGAYTFQISTLQCTQFKGTWSSQSNADFVSGPVTPGSCRGVCSQSYKRDLEMLDASFAKRDIVVSPAGKTYNNTATS